MRQIDYYFSLVSPWAYFGHAPFLATAQRHGCTVTYKPVFLGEVFSETGGLPLARRHPVRQRYRLVELQRWREKRGVPLNLQPAFWPFEVSLADRCVIALQAAGIDPAAFTARAFAGVWARDENLADEAVLAAIATEVGVDAGMMLAGAHGESAKATYAGNIADAIAAEVFGSPSYVIDGEVFWGQDRLDLLADMLASGRPAYSSDV
ncbi:2-hydroxychromene-2-carboxylate isomerase [Chelatococcus daeguensis]|uniref:2-hydroxychromene-2-carboxylate isomerase n=2 Tax=Chelatococcus TaxID=28209 RepID=A0AAC9JQZ3_9HYPH|nr:MULTISPECIES: 2-hydroxychromene-2-carboxylate isomerase [Chelatococcus]APF38607.1 disulfide bond formation protein DsbA [Chelatococcus daeguensis]KZE36264.1 disulfide bond formation protein DsbA [Chelatococcus daeguensis]MBM3084259.1 2-hydroxychromene-2-carboxylate isomerase [Chelatococcus daeguensis]CUA89512.1 2-hydroxychromene-2-carboxylate isomerase [Chelatococcus sambhunathii]